MMSLQIIRTWFKVGKMFMNYIVTSPEKPLGTIEKHWWRWEYQDASGNLPHIHCLLWTKEDKADPVDLAKLQDKVRCSLGSFFKTPSEVQSYVDEGLLPDASVETISDVLDSVKKILFHSCAQAGYRCMRRVGPKEGDLQCHVVDYFEENPIPSSYGYKNINPLHRQEAMDLFEELGLYDEHGSPLDARFAAGQYVYPANYGERLSPCNPHLFVAHRSSDNLVLTDTYFSCRYLAKYVQGVDENCKVNIKAGGEKGKMVMEEEAVANTKISTGKIMQEKRQKKKRQNPSYSGRALGLPEAVGLMLKEQQVFTDATFVSIPTVPLEQRPAHERVARAQWCQDIRQEASSRQTKQQQVPVGRGNSNFLGQQVWQSLALDGERQFSTMEEIIIRDALASPLSLDAITLFGCRPPELRFLKSPTYYYSYFTRLSHKNPNKVTQKTTTEELLHQDLFKCGWVDGLDCQVLVKPQAIQDILMLSECVGEVRELFHCLNYIVHDVANSMNYYLDLSTQDLEAMYHRFIDIKYGKDTALPLALFNVAKPTQGNRFLIHVLLSMGKFNNEGELFAGTTMTKFFQNAQLLPTNLPVTEEDVRHIT